MNPAQWYFPTSLLRQLQKMQLNWSRVMGQHSSLLTALLTGFENIESSAIVIESMEHSPIIKSYIFWLKLNITPVWDDESSLFDAIKLKILENPETPEIILKLIKLIWQKICKNKTELTADFGLASVKLQRLPDFTLKIRKLNSFR